MRERAIIPYRPNLKELSKQLRKKSTLSEVLLWRCLKGKQVLGFDFDRQRPIDKYIVDFYCKELRLAVEIDGSTHDDRIEEDRIRQERLEFLGVKVLRFGDIDVKRNIEGVVEEIKKWIAGNAPTPVPSQEGNAPTPAPPKRGMHPPLPLRRRGYEPNRHLHQEPVKSQATPD